MGEVAAGHADDGGPVNNEGAHRLDRLRKQLHIGLPAGTQGRARMSRAGEKDEEGRGN